MPAFSSSDFQMVSSHFHCHSSFLFSICGNRCCPTTSIMFRLAKKRKIEVRKYCRYSTKLQNEYLLAKIGSDTAENEPSKVLATFVNMIYRKKTSTQNCRSPRGECQGSKKVPAGRAGGSARAHAAAGPAEACCARTKREDSWLQRLCDTHTAGKTDRPKVDGRGLCPGGRAPGRGNSPGFGGAATPPAGGQVRAARAREPQGASTGHQAPQSERRNS